jgi:hypothetical protein
MSAVNPMENCVFLVPPSRLAWGKYVEDQRIGEGDILASYSADRICGNQPVRKPFEWQGCLWVCVMSGSGLTVLNELEAIAFRLVPVKLFNGETTTYRARTATDVLSDAARNDPMGFYNGMAVKHGKNAYVLCGPPAIFMAGEEQTGSEPLESGVQLGLF